MADKVSNIFGLRINAPAKSNFDKYYVDIEVKQVYRKAGVDSDGEEYGTIEDKFVISKRDIVEFINSQLDSVGIESYMKALAVKGVTFDDFDVHVSNDVQDFTDVPKDKFEGSLYGDRAIDIFNNLDPDLKGNHTTIAGFLNSLSKEKIDSYIKGKVDAAFPKTEVKGE